MEGKNGVKQNPSEEKKEKKEKKGKKKNIGRCYSKLLTQFTVNEH